MVVVAICQPSPSSRGGRDNREGGVPRCDNVSEFGKEKREDITGVGRTAAMKKSSD